VLENAGCKHSKFDQQEQRHWNSVYKTMRDTFQYMDKAGRPAVLSQQCLKKARALVMKTYRALLKTIFLDNGGYNKKVNTPYGVDESQWQRLVS
jgi:hypothetical protein